MGKYAHGDGLKHKVYESMGELWLTTKEIVLLSRRDREIVSEAVSEAVRHGWAWSRQRAPGLVEYQLKREVRDSIRHFLSSRISLTGQKGRRRKTNADANI